MNSKIASKRALRETMRARLGEASVEAGVSFEARAALNRRLSELLRNLPETQEGHWAGFQAIGYEPDVSSALEATPERRWVFPRISGEQLEFFQPQGAESFVTSALGIREPDPARSRRIEWNDVRGLVIPGLAFDLSLNRLGRGRGFYDRALGRSSQSKTPIKIGVAFDRQISDLEIPTESFDVPMDWVVTETRLLKSRGGKDASGDDSRKEES